MFIMKKVFFTLLFALLFGATYSQQKGSGEFTFSGYLESYYSYDFNRPDDHNRPSFLYNFSRHNEFSFNLALVKATYSSDQIRGNLALMGGTYAQFNLADEPVWARLLNEASIGVRLHPKLWLDVGIMPSHIGFESWYGMDGWHLTRSLMAENSPYFLTGARFTYELSPKMDLTLWLTNGWQNVQRQERKQGLGFGLGVNHRPTEGLQINYSNYFGNEGPDPVRLLRFFNNFYVQYEPNKWGVTVGGDFGIQEAYFGNPHQWYGVTASLRRALGEKFYLAGRIEQYSDPKGIILNEGLKISGISANLDYNIQENVMFRVEARQFISPAAVFTLPGARFSKGNTAVTGSLALRF